jgi:hypothetical protein
MTDQTPTPLNEDDLIAKAHQMIGEDRDKEALPFVRQALRINPHNTGAMLLYAQLTTDKNLAIETLQDLLVMEPSNMEAKLLLRRLERSIDIPEKPKNDSPQTPSDNNSALMQQLLQQNQMLMAQAKGTKEQPVINIVNANNSTATANPTVNATATIGGSPVTLASAKPEINRTAQWIGFLSALFLGIYGVAHFLNGKILRGLLWLFLLGPIFVYTFLSPLTSPDTSSVICFTFAIHLFAAWYHARNGAKRKKI